MAVYSFFFGGGGVALGGRCSAPVLEHADSVAVVRGLTYPSVCRILVPHKWSNLHPYKEPTCNVGDWGSIPGLGRSLAEVNGNPLQYSCLENPMDRGTWQATVHGGARVGHDSATKPPLPRWQGDFFFSTTATWEAQKVLVMQSCPAFCEPARLLRPRNSPGKKTGRGSHSLLWREVPVVY